MEALMLNVLIMAVCIGGPLMVLQLPIMVNEDGSLHKWHWPYKIGLAVLVGATCFYFAPFAMQWFAQ